MIRELNPVRLMLAGAMLVVGVSATQLLSSGQAEAADYYNGFETDTNGWFGPITRVPSGSKGIPSKTGSWHAEVDGSGQAGTQFSSAFTRWGGYESTFPPTGYITSVDIYLDFPPPAGSSLQNDMRFDFSSAINDPSGNHRRDFVFNAGYYNDAVPPGVGSRYVISASTNAGRANSSPKNPGRDPFVITTEGWYTFEHRFNNTGVLTVTLTIKNALGIPLKSWMLTDPTDIIGVTVGGNRYGWFANNELDFLAIDNSLKDGTEAEDNVDHFACYDVQEITRMPRRTVTLRDQFGPPENKPPLNATVKSARTLCAPVDKNGEGIVFEDFHLVCYDVATSNSPDRYVSVENQFGEQKLRVKRRDVLCVPSSKEIISRPRPDGGHHDEDDDKDRDDD